MKFPITLLTGKRAQSNACSLFIYSKGKDSVIMRNRMLMKKINSGRLKEFTGGDKIEGRGLY